MHEMRTNANGERLAPCSQCGTPMRDMGLDFKAPPQTDVKQWRKVETLFQSGFTYQSCGCGPGYRPASQWEIPAFVKEQKQIQAEWQRRRDAILKRNALASGNAGGNKP